MIDIEDYQLAGHLTRWYEYYSGLEDLADHAHNPYGFSNNAIDCPQLSYAIAKMTAAKYCKYLTR